MSQSKKINLLAFVDFHILYLTSLPLVALLFWLPRGSLVYFLPFLFPQGVILVQVIDRRKQGYDWIKYLFSNELLAIGLCAIVYALTKFIYF